MLEGAIDREWRRAHEHPRQEQDHQQCQKKADQWRADDRKGGRQQAMPDDSRGAGLGDAGTDQPAD